MTTPADSFRYLREREEDLELEENAGPGGDWEQPARSWLAGALDEMAFATTDPDPGHVAFLRSMDYRKRYLTSDRWRRTRAQAIASAGHRCKRCGDYGHALDVHHLTYERLGRELADDLVVPCRSCHEQAHGK